MASSQEAKGKTLEQEKNWVAALISHTPAHEDTAAVAPFRAWRG